MKKGLLFTASLAALTLGVVACNNGGGSGKKVAQVTISNKDVLEAEWFVEDDNRPLQFTISDGTPAADALYDGDLVVTSSDESVISVVGEMSSEIHAVSAGTATITATYKKKTSDSVTIEVKNRPTMRVVTTIDTTRDDYMMRWYANGKTLFASDEMNGFYVKPVDIDHAKTLSVTEDENPEGDYKYVITIGEKVLGKYDGSHKNIGFVGDQVEDGGVKHDIVKALFKFDTSNYKLSTMFGSEEYFLAAYSGTRDDRLAYQKGEGIGDAAYARLVEYGDPIHAEDIILDKEEMTLKAGGTGKITATIEPNISTDTVAWESSDESVAKVVDGVVVAYKEGTCNIIAKAGPVEVACALHVVGVINYGTSEAPLTADEAHELLANEFADGTQTPFQLYVEGLVYTRAQAYADDPNSHTLTLTKEDGSYVDANYLTVYGAKYEGTIAPGYTVKAKGYAKIYNGTYELAPGKGLGESKNTNPSILEATEGVLPLTGIKLTPEEASVNVFEGDQVVQLSVAPLPESATLGTVTYEVGNNQAGVNVDENGQVAVLSSSFTEGQTVDVTITARCGDLSDSMVIHVSKTGETPVEETKVIDFTAKTANHNSYGDEWSYGDVKVAGGANNNGQWAYIKLGPKSATISGDSYIGTYIKTGQIDFAVKTVTLDLLGKSYNQADEKASVHVESYSDATFTTKVAETDAKETPAITTAGERASISFSFTAANEDLYYKIVVDVTNTTTYNGVFCLEKVTFSNL